MANDVATVYAGQIRLGRAPASNELLLGDANGNFELTPASSIAPSIQTQLDSISNVQGSVLYRGASAWSALAPSTAGHVLSTNGAGANPSWVAQTPPYTPTWTEGALSANSVTVTNSTVLVDAANSPVTTSLSFFVTAGAFYSFEFGLIISTTRTTTNSGGCRVAVSIPTSGGSLIFGAGNSNNTAGTFTGGGTSAPITLIPASTTSGTAYYAATVLGTFDCTSSGTLKLLFAEATAAASTSTTILKGSWLRYRTV